MVSGAIEKDIDLYAVAVGQDGRVAVLQSDDGCRLLHVARQQKLARTLPMAEVNLQRVKQTVAGQLI